MSISLAETNGKVQGILDKVINNFESLDISGKNSNLKDQLIQALVDREMLKICMVGQYSAGKSSIVKMLTGNEDIKIAAGIATAEATPHRWNGVWITDTPGIATGIREEHDKISQEAITDSDMLIFTITYNLFDNTMAKEFTKLAFDQCKHDSMILVVNKMGSSNKGNTPEQQNIIKDAIKEILAKYDKTPEDFYICFTDANDYLEALNEDDMEYKKELMQSSGYEAFTETLGRFIAEKGIISKITRPLHVCADILDKLEESYTGLDEYDTSKIAGQMNDLRMAIEEADYSINSNANKIFNTIVAAGQEVSSVIQYDCSPEDVANTEMGVQQNIKMVIDGCVDDIYRKYVEIGNMYGIQVTRKDIDYISMAVHTGNISGDILIGDTLKKGIQGSSAMAAKGMNAWAEVATKSAQEASKTATTAWSNTNMFSKLFNTQAYQTAQSAQNAATQAAQNASKLTTAAKFAGPALAAVGLILEAWNQHQKAKEEKRLSSLRAEVARKYSDNANNAKTQFKSCAGSMKKVFENMLKGSQSDMEKAKFQKKQQADNVQLINQYNSEIRTLINSLEV